MEQLALDGLDLPTKTVRVRFHPNFYEISREERLNALIEVRLPELCGFLSGWYDESVAPDLPYELRIFRHEDMKRDLQGFFGGILDFLGVPAAARRDIARESKSGEELGKSYGEHFFRLGSSDEWRAEMNAVQTERMRQIIPPGLLQKFGWRE